MDRHDNLPSERIERTSNAPAERRELSLDIEVLEDRIAPAFLGGGLRSGGFPIVWRGDECCN